MVFALCLNAIGLGLGCDAHSDSNVFVPSVSVETDTAAIAVTDATLRGYCSGTNIVGFPTAAKGATLISAARHARPGARLLNAPVTGVAPQCR